MTARPLKMRAQTRAVRLAGLNGQVTSFVAFISLDHGAEVRVRFATTGASPWRCDACGPQHQPTCPHAAAAADVFTTYQRNNPPPTDTEDTNR